MTLYQKLNPEEYNSAIIIFQYAEKYTITEKELEKFKQMSANILATKT